MKLHRPNWNAEQINQNMRRWEDLIDLTENHEFRIPECECRNCYEELGLRTNLGLFTESEKADAVIKMNAHYSF